MRSEFSLPDGSMGKNFIIFGVDMSSSVHLDNKDIKKISYIGKNILIPVKSPTQGLDDTKLLGEAQYSINFSRPNRKFCLSRHYNRSNSFIFVNATKVHQFKGKMSEIKKYPLCLGNISGDFLASNMKKTGLKLTDIVSASNHTNCVLLSNQKCMIQPTLINLHPNEYCQKFHYYPCLVKLDRCVGSSNPLNDLSNKLCVPNKIRSKSKCLQHDYRNK